jgi:Tol biopolymer transport system component
MAVAVSRHVKYGLVIVLGWMAQSSLASADRIVDTREVVRGDYLAPRFAPDGRALAVTGPKLKGLAIVAVDGSAAPRALVDDEAAGVHARWTSAGTIEYRAIRAGARRDLVVDLAGVVRVRDTAKLAAPIAVAQDDRIFVRDRAGATIKVGSGDRFFGPVVSPDGDKVAFEGLATGIHIYTRSTGALVRVGTGTAPAWSPDSARLVFERTEDDGHDIVASELFVYHAGSRQLSQLTATEDRIERRPSFSPDGARIAFDDNAGAILVGRLEVTP